MDEMPQPQQPAQNNQKVWDAKTIVIVSSIVILFVGVFAVNYFNIVPLYKMIPGFWRLPRYIPKTASFPYDTKANEATLHAFLQKNVAPAFLSNSLRYFHFNVITQANWIIRKENYSITFDSKLFTDIASNNVRYAQVFAYPALPVDKANLRNTLASYFNVSLPQTIPCFNDPQTKSTYCQQLTRIGQTRQIVGAQFGYNGASSSAQTDWLYYCELYQHVADNQLVSCANVH